MIQSIEISVNQAQIDHVNKILHTMPDKAKIVFRNAFNRGLLAAKTQGTKETRQRYDIKTGNLQAHSKTEIRNAGEWGSDIEGQISFSGTKIPLYKFHPSPALRRYTNRYVNGIGGWRITTEVSAADAKETGMLKRGAGFIATFQSGHTGIFKRVGNGKIQEYWGFSLADMLDYEEARNAILERSEEIVSKRLDQELYRILNGF